MLKLLLLLLVILIGRFEKIHRTRVIAIDSPCHFSAMHRPVGKVLSRFIVVTSDLTVATPFETASYFSLPLSFLLLDTGVLYLFADPCQCDCERAVCKCQGLFRAARLLSRKCPSFRLEHRKCVCQCRVLMNHPNRGGMDVSRLEVSVDLCRTLLSSRWSVRGILPRSSHPLDDLQQPLPALLEHSIRLLLLVPVKDPCCSQDSEMHDAL